MPQLSAYIVTFNCARSLVDPQEFAAHFFRPYRDNAASLLPDIVVLSLQEVAPIAYAFLGGSYLTPYYDKIIEAVKLSSQSAQDYEHFMTRNVGMTSLLIMAKPGIIPTLVNLASAGVGTGLSEMANKGAVGIRLGLGEGSVRELTFVAAHLTPHEANFARRNEDWKSIVRSLVFQPETRPVPGQESDAAGESEPLLESRSGSDTTPKRGIFTSRSPLFFAGDLNYRTSDTPPESETYKQFPPPNSDPLDNDRARELKASDQLERERKAGRTLDQLAEADVAFAPTYKYAEPQQPSSGTDGVTAKSRGWAKHRYPSWCDRVLFSGYLMEQDCPFKVQSYTSLPLLSTSDHRPVALAFQIDTTASAWSNISEFVNTGSPYPIDLSWQDRRDMAKRKEYAVGFMAYFALTWEGNGIFLASFIGAVGGWFVVRSILG